MRLNDTSRYGLRALVHLAQAGGQLRSTRGIHAAEQIPYKYLGHLMVVLRDAGLVEASAGRHGGYRLARPPEAISLLQVIEALQGLEAFEGCLLGLGLCALDGATCALHARLDPIRQELIDTIRTVSLAELAAGRAVPALLSLSAPPTPKEQP